MDNLLTLIGQSAGFIIGALCLCSVIALYVVLEKIYILYLRSRVVQKDCNYWLNLDYSQLTTSSLKNQKMLHILMHSFIHDIPLSEEKIRNILHQKYKSIEFQLSLQLNFLELITQIAPLLGLLGTVLGMVDVFTSISIQDPSSQLLSSGISQALTTTIIGLSIAIPSFIAHNLFEKRIEKILNALDKQVEDILNQKKTIFFHDE